MSFQNVKVLLIVVFVLFVFQRPSHSLIYISEIYADPALGLKGDANNDGIRHFSDDEFVEFFNDSDIDLDLSGWTISDSVGIRHVFGQNSMVGSNKNIVVFGGGSVNLNLMNYQLASTGTLSLNNSFDSIFLKDNLGALIDYVFYDDLADNDQSILRNSRQESDAFILYSEYDKLKTYGPGVNENIVKTNSVPEKSTFLLFSLASFIIVIIRSSFKNQLIKSSLYLYEIFN